MHLGPKFRRLLTFSEGVGLLRGDLSLRAAAMELLMLPFPSKSLARFNCGEVLRAAIFVNVAWDAH